MANHLLTFTDLKGFTDRKAGVLSGGMKQKLGLACALISKPELLLLDEPGVGVELVPSPFFPEQIHINLFHFSNLARCRKTPAD